MSARPAGALAAALMLAPAGAWANGTITGTVRADPVPQNPPAPKVVKDESVCGREAARDALILGKGGALANAVVSLRGIKAARPAPTVGAAIDQVGCRYTPHVQAVTVGTALNLLNNDAVLHNVHGTLEGGSSPITVFNVAMPFKGQKTPAVLKRPGPVKLRCDAGHTWMSAYVYVFDHPYFAVTDAEGRFTIKDVPAGKYELEVWHEPIGEKLAPVTRTVPVGVTDGKPTAADVQLSF